MQTDRIKVNSNGNGIERALDEASKFASYIELDRSKALRIRLLSEETMGMVSTITEDFEAEFWIEGSKDEVCSIHLLANTRMNSGKKQELIAASTAKKNAAAKGFMGKIKEIIENGLYGINDIEQLNEAYGGAMLMYGSMGAADFENAAMRSCVTLWSLEKYKNSIGETKDTDEAAGEAWDELEKSIVASLADDVRVAISGDKVEMVIEKKF